MLWCSISIIIFLSRINYSNSQQNNKNNNEVTTKLRVGIIGAGLGGTSAAYYLRQNFHNNQCNFNDIKHQLDVTVFEAGHVGGRLATIKMNGIDYEAGGSIIHPSNKNMNELTHSAGLTKRRTLTHLSQWQLNKFSILLKNQIIFTKSTNWFYSHLDLLWRYGLWNLYLLKKIVNESIENFMQVYPFLENGQHVDIVSDMMLIFSSHEGEALQMIDISAKKYLLDKGISEKLIDELITVALKTNYGQMPSTLHTFVGLTALAGIQDGLWAVDGGNKRVPQEILKLSKAELKRKKVNSVSKLSNGAYQILYCDNSSNDDEWLFKEGLKESLSKEIINEKESIFDVVIIATPMTKDKATFDLKGFKKTPKFPGRYHRTVATFVRGDLNYNYFNYKSHEDLASQFFFIDNPKDNIINSVQLLLPAEIPKTLKLEPPYVWKIFSQETIPNELLNKMFKNIEEVKVADWLAYPHYHPHEMKLLGNFTIDDGLYYINSIENAASAMETITIASKNIANTIKESFCQKIDEKKDKLFRKTDEL